MQIFLNMMTPTEREKFRDSTLNNEEKPQTRKPMNPLSRETSPHTNQVSMGILPSRETGPHISQVLRRLAKIPEQCEECGGEHPTCICIKQFEKLHTPEPAMLPTSDNESTGSDTLYDSEESENDETETSQPTRPTKTVTFDLPEEESSEPGDTFTETTELMDKFADKTEEQVNEREGCRTQATTYQSDEADARLVHVVWLWKTSDNVYMSNRKSMNLRTYVHAAH